MFLFVVEVENRRTSYHSLKHLIKVKFPALRRYMSSPVSMLLSATLVPSKNITSAHLYWSVQSLDATCPAERGRSTLKVHPEHGAEPGPDQTGSPALWGRWPGL